MPDRQWSMTVDAIVIGTGGGAFCAALALRAAGHAPLMLEKESAVGGSTSMSGGMMWMPNNPQQQAAGVDDSVERSLAYLDALVGDAGPSASPARRRAYVETVPQVVDFLATQGVVLRRCPGYSDYHDELPGGCPEGRSMAADIFDTRRLKDGWEARLKRGPFAMPIVGSEFRQLPLAKRTPGGLLAAARLGARMAWSKLTGSRLVGMGSALQGRMLEAALAAGIRIETEAPVSEIVIEDGRAVGVIARLGGQDVAIRATGGILIAAGGFARNEAMRQRYLPQPTSSAWTNANAGDTGDLLEAAIKAGAATDLLDEAVWVSISLPPGAQNPAIHSASDLAKPHIILVDRAGHRFTDEAQSYMKRGQDQYAANAVPAWAIIESRFRNRYFWAGAAPGRIPEAWLASGYWVSAPTIAELAGKCGIDAAGLAETIKRFNGFAAAGKDLDYKRGDRAYDRWFGDPRNRPNASLGAIERPPFHAVKIYPGDVGTFGGVVADEDARVVNTAGQPIPGLYACGNVTASVFGRRYPGAGASIGASLVFGYRGARAIADTLAQANA